MNKLLTRYKLVCNVMNSVKAMMNYMLNDTDLEDDEWLTSKNINDIVLVATANEFIITDKDKFKLLEISENNRFLV